MVYFTPSHVIFWLIQTQIIIHYIFLQLMMSGNTTHLKQLNAHPCDAGALAEGAASFVFVSELV